MPSKSLTATEVSRNFSDYLNRVQYRRESFIVCKGKKPIAEIRPVPQGLRLGDLPGILASLPRLSKEEAEAFAKDIREAKENMPKEGLRDPWES